MPTTNVVDPPKSYLKARALSTFLALSAEEGNLHAVAKISTAQGSLGFFMTTSPGHWLATVGDINVWPFGNYGSYTASGPTEESALLKLLEWLERESVMAGLSCRGC